MFEDLPKDVLREIIKRAGAPMTHYVVLRHVSRGFAGLLRPSNYRVPICERIVRTPYTGLMDWAISVGYKPGPDICTSADEAGNLVMLKHLRGLGFDWDASLESSAWRGHLEIIQYGVENGYSVGMSLPHAAEAGHLEICKFIYSLDPDIDDYTCLCAARSPHKHIVRWIIETDVRCKLWLCRGAYEGGNLKIAKLLKKLGYFYYDLYIFAMNDYGHLDLLRGLHEFGMLGAVDASSAAEAGHLHFLKWFKENGVAFNYGDCIARAEAMGYTECVEWLRANR